MPVLQASDRFCVSYILDTPLSLIYHPYFSGECRCNLIEFMGTDGSHSYAPRHIPIAVSI
jgi:hypothetical protein